MRLKRFGLSFLRFSFNRETQRALISRSFDMKSWRVLPVAGALLLVGASVADATDMQPDEQQAAQPAPPQNSNASTQSGVETSYGGVSSTQSASGSTHTRSCMTGPQCDIFFGRH